MSFQAVLKSNSAALGLIAALLLPLTPHAQQETPVIFEQTKIHIDPVIIEKDADGNAPVEARLSSNFDVEVRSEDAARLEDIPSLNTLADTAGMMIVFTAPILTALPRMNNYTPVDAIFIAEDGSIMSTTSNVNLSELHDQELTQEPVKALLFLKAGSVKAHGILAKDVVSGTMFVNNVQPPKLQIMQEARPRSPQTPARADNRPPTSDGSLLENPWASAPEARP